MPLNPLRKYLVSRRREQGGLQKGDRCEVLTVIRFGAFAVEGTRLGCGDPSQLPLGVSVNSGAGSYQLEAECLVYPGDPRVARVTAKRTNAAAVRGDRVGQIGVDLALACFFDAERLETFASERPDAYDQWIEDHVVMCDWAEAGTLSCRSAKTKIPYFEVGFGDGLYDVFELREGESIVGLELVCLEAGASYPFDPRVAIAGESPSGDAVGDVEIPDLELLVGSLQKSFATFTGSETVEEIAEIAKQAVDRAFHKDKPE